MKDIKSYELRKMYLDFFKSKGHAVIPSASLIPDNDPTVLFTTAGMHPLVPYLMGEKHPAGTRLTDVQKCVRTGDIDEVGDYSHCTFFEMLGNWSLGDYFKKEAISWSYEFLTSEEYLGIPKEKLYFSCFAGDDDAPKDEESAQYWMDCGVDKSHIFFLPKENNWWGPAGITGPCGPDTEIFYDTGKPACGPDCSPACSCGKYLEIWNNVFMAYNKKEDGTYEPLAQKNVDTGMGLDRTICTLQGKKSVYDTDVFEGIIGKIADLSGKDYDDDEETMKAFRIVADHIRCATFILGDRNGVTPSNVDQGYILRRLIRRAIRYAQNLGIEEGGLCLISKQVIKQYGEIYPELAENEEKIMNELTLEEQRFSKTITAGIKEFEKVVSHMRDTTVLNGKTAFRLYDTFGFPIEFTLELAAEKGLTVDLEGYKEAFKKHQEKSQAGAEQRFKGGLADAGERTARLHTATHLLLGGLRKVLGDTVYQRGSNITAERLRFDFNFNRPMTPEEIKAVEDYVNEAISKKIDVVCEEMTVPEAKAQGAIGVFDDRYTERVKVYTMGEYDKEICGGPHAANTGELVHFTIQKEQSSSAGVRRIRATIEG